jgi:hypothetical protein
VLGEEDDLPGVLAVVRELAVDGLDDRVRLAADEDAAVNVFGLQRFERAEEGAPARLPALLNRLAVFALDEELGVPVAAPSASFFWPRKTRTTSFK